MLIDSLKSLGIKALSSYEDSYKQGLVLHSISHTCPS